MTKSFHSLFLAIQDLVSCLPLDANGALVVTATRRNCLDLCDHAPNAVLRAPPAAAVPHTRLDTFARLHAIVAHAYNGDTKMSNAEHISGDSGSGLSVGSKSGNRATQATAATAPGHGTNPFTASTAAATRRQSSGGVYPEASAARPLPLQARALACCELRWQSSRSFARGNYASAASEAARARAALDPYGDTANGREHAVGAATPLPPPPLRVPEQPSCVEGRAGPGLSDADDTIAIQAAAYQAPSTNPPPNNDNDNYLLLRLKCWVSEGSARLALDEGEAALACADAAIAVATEAAKNINSTAAAAASSTTLLASTPSVPANSTCKNEGLGPAGHTPAEPWVLRADALLFMDLGVKRASSSLAWASSASQTSFTTRALDAYCVALAYADRLRAAGAPRQLRLPFEESRRIKKRIQDLSNF